MNYKKITLGAFAYFISSFVIQGLLGFAFAGDYFLSISIFRNPPIIYLALPQTIVAGIAFAILYPITNFRGNPVLKGLKFNLFKCLKKPVMSVLNPFKLLPFLTRVFTALISLASRAALSGSIKSKSKTFSL